MRIVLAVAAGLAALAAALWVGAQPWILAVLAVAEAGALVLLVRGVRRDRGFVAASGYEWHRQAPDHVREPGAVEGVVLPRALPDKRLPHA